MKFDVDKQYREPGDLSGMLDRIGQLLKDDEPEDVSEDKKEELTNALKDVMDTISEDRESKEAKIVLENQELTNSIYSTLTKAQESQDTLTSVCTQILDVLREKAKEKKKWTCVITRGRSGEIKTVDIEEL